MSDIWGFENKQETQEVPAAPADPTPAEKEETAAPVPAEPVQQPQTPVPPAQQPPVPPVNGWGPDGSYRYVPPRSGQPGAVPPSQPYGAPQSAPR